MKNSVIIYLIYLGSIILELVYLWVEDYKNIHKQGFNFSPRFTCEFKDEYDADGKLKDNCELIICDKKKKECKDNDYIQNFFGDNINVTAIVGKNGSGKSSVFEVILDILAERYDDYVYVNYIIMYRINDELYLNKNIDINLNNEIKMENDYILRQNSSLITLLLDNQYEKPALRDSEQLFIENNKYEKNYSNKIFISNYLNYKDILIENKEKYFTPNIVTLRIGYKNFTSLLNEDKDLYEKDIWDKIIKLIKELSDKSLAQKLGLVNKIFKIKKEEHKEFPPFTFGDGVSDSYFNKYNFNTELLENIPDLIRDDGDPIRIDINKIDEEVFTFLKKLPYVFEIDLIDENKKSFKDLSFGEKQLLLQSHYVLYHSSFKSYEEYHPPQSYHDTEGNLIDERDEYFEEHNINNVLILLDEFEIGLHPSWQKKAINYMIEFLKKFNKNFHFITTTHSPFLLSDIPKQNIIFLDTYKDEDIAVKDEKQKVGNCKVVDGLKEKKQTFGANIHTLLSDSFFMEDGLMGEFAKGKINEIIDFHKEVEEENRKEKSNLVPLQTRYKSDKKRFWQTQSIIGEDYLKQVIKNHLRDIEKVLLNHDEAKQEEIKRLRKEADRLENM